MTGWLISQLGTSNIKYDEKKNLATSGNIFSSIDAYDKNILNDRDKIQVKNEASNVYGINPTPHYIR